MQNSTLVWIIIVALIILGGGWYFFSMQEPVSDDNEEVGTEEPTDSPDAPGGASTDNGTGGTGSE